MNPVITESYRLEQIALHARGNYGTTGQAYGPFIGNLAKKLNVMSLLDYGCGSRRSLLSTLQLPEGVVYEGYDPAVPDYAAEPMPAELVSCIDVLEHIEPPLLGNVLDHLASLCDPFGFFTIHTGPAKKVLSDGRNAHLIQEPAAWWRTRLDERFDVHSQVAIPNGFCVLVKAKNSNATMPSSFESEFARFFPQSQSISKSRPLQGVVEYGSQEMLFETPNDMTAWRVKSMYEKEPDTIRWLESMPEGAILVDVGANVGMYSVFAAVVRKAKVYAFEPESQNYALLNANIAANSLSDRILAYPLALSDQMQVDKLYLSKFSAGGSCHSFAEAVGFNLKPRPAPFAQGCISMTLDQLVESGVVPLPQYIKLDVDGIEHKVIAGARKTLANPKVLSIIVELNTHLAEHREAISMLRSFGFDYNEAQVAGALRKEGAFEGVGEFIFSRKLAEKSVSVDFARTYKFGLPPSSKGRAVLNHVLDRLAATPMTTQPFPYLVIDDIFPDDYYAEMLAHFPTKTSLRPIGETGRVPQGAYVERLTVLFTDDEFARMSTTQQAFWQEFASWMYTDQFMAAFVAKFSEQLEPRLAKILAAEKSLLLKGDALLVNDQTNYAIGPHTDAPHRLISFLFYLPSDTSMRELGTSVYEHQDPSFVCWGGPHHPFTNFTKVATVEFLPNRLMVFPKTEKSFHGVEQIKREGVDRPLLINNVRLLNKTTH